MLMSTEHNFDIGSEQHAFIQKDLTAVNRSATPWLIFAGHRPMYSVAKLEEHGYMAGICSLNRS